MKKTIILLLALALLASGCAAAAEDPAARETLTMPVLPEQTQQTAPQLSREVTVTLENWDRYFELKTLCLPSQDPQTGLKTWEFGVALVLKEPWLEAYAGGQVDFALSYQETLYAFTGDPRTGEYEIGEPVQTDYVPEPRGKTFALQDFRREDLPADSALSGMVAGYLYCGMAAEREDGSMAVYLPEQAEVDQAEGVLKFK